LTLHPGPATFNLHPFFPKVFQVIIGELIVQDLKKIENAYDSLAKEYAEEFLGKTINIDFMFFTTEFISSCFSKSGFEKVEVIERDPYPEVEYQSRRAYVFGIKPETMNPR
jgi:hypothetical protein